MANSQWGRDWYEAPTETTRDGKTYYFVGNIENGSGTFTREGIRRLKEVARAKGIRVCVTYRAANLNVGELWATDAALDEQVHAERIE